MQQVAGILGAPQCLAGTPHSIPRHLNSRIHPLVHTTRERNRSIDFYPLFTHSLADTITPDSRYSDSLLNSDSHPLLFFRPCTYPISGATYTFSASYSKNDQPRPTPSPLPLANQKQSRRNCQAEQRKLMMNMYDEGLTTKDG